jgi:hypothetical protein
MNKLLLGQDLISEKTSYYWEGFSKITQIFYFYKNTTIVDTFENGKFKLSEIGENSTIKLKQNETNRA